jgi:prophage regulatory protein
VTVETIAPSSPSRDLLPLEVVEQRTGYRKSKLYQLIAAGAFPQPVRPGARAIRFVSTEVDDWVAARIAERDATIGRTKRLLVKEGEIAEAIGVSVSWLQKDRCRREGPRVPFVRVGPHVRYDVEVALAAAKAQQIGGVAP